MSRPLTGPRQAHWALIALLVLVHLSLGTVYAVALPSWEGQDETGHYPYARYLAEERRFPPRDAGLSVWSDESHQPPLFYALAAGLIGLEPSGSQRQPDLNYFFFRGTGRGGYNLAVHPPAEAPPYEGEHLRIRLVRLLSALATAAIAPLAYVVAGGLLPRRPAARLAAAGLAAFLPMLLYTGGIANNDGLTFALFALAFVTVWRALELGQARLFVAAGAVVGLTLLTKHSGLSLVLAVSSIWLWSWRRSAGLWSHVRAGLLLSAPAALVSGWWYARNWLVTGQLIPDRVEDNPITQTIAPLITSVGQTMSLAWWGRLGEHTFRTFWGSFGWGNLPLRPDVWYVGLGLVTALALVGLARRDGGSSLLALARIGPRRRCGLPRPALAWAALFTLWVVALPLYRAVFFTDVFLMPGRYLLPATLPITMALAVGLLGWRVLRRAGGTTVWLGSLALGALAPFAFILPEYRAGEVLPPGTAPPNPVSVYFGDGMELVGYEIGAGRVEPGGELPVTLYWRARREMERNYTVGLSLLGRGLVPVGKYDAFPGNGTRATSTWRPGVLLRDTYRVPFRGDGEVPALGQLAIQVHTFPEDEVLSTRDPSGRAITPIVGRFKLAAASVPDGPRRALATFGDRIALVEAESEPIGPRRWRVRLVWQCLRPIERDLTVFVHLMGRLGVLSEAREPVATGDGPPAGGFYPTGLWEPFELVEDVHEVELPAASPAGPYDLRVGWYDPTTGQRLTTNAGADHVPLGEVDAR